MEFWQEAFNKIFNETVKTEDIEECPLVLHGVLFNTDTDRKALDAEAITGGAEIITDGESLKEFLEGLSYFDLDELKKQLEEI